MFMFHGQTPILTATTHVFGRNDAKDDQGASHGGSEKPGKLEVGGASRDSTGFGALEEGLISS